jgi:hypothetical protein
MPQQDLGEDHDEALDQNGLVIPDLNLEQEEFFQPFDDHGNHGNALPDLNLQEEISIGSISVDRSSQSQENIIAAEHDDQENLNVDLVLALPAEPVNFMPLELQPHELNAMVSSDSESSNPLSAALEGNSFGEAGSEGPPLQPNAIGQGSERNEDVIQGVQQPIPENLESEGQVGNSSETIQVGMVLLPDNLDCDPGFLNDQDSSVPGKCSQINADAIRLWARHFAPLGNSGGIDIP